MKKNVIGVVIFFSLLALAGLSMYIYAARTGSGYRMKEFHRTAGHLEDRISALEKQRDLLGETVTALEGQADAILAHSQELSRRIGQIDSELSNMKDLIGGAKKSVRTPIFSLRGFRVTAGSGIIIIAFLAFIWLLYTSLRSRSDEGDPLSAGGGDDEDAREPVPGSVLEEEFPPTPEGEEGPGCGGTSDEHQPGDDPTPAGEGGAEADEPLEAGEPPPEKPGEQSPPDTRGESPEGGSEGEETK
jgi:hypothetical protein